MLVLRSVLYMPGSNQRALEKARDLNADAYIFDLEDAVGPASKNIARQNIIAALAQGGYRSTVVVRINALDTKWWQEDLHALKEGGFDALLLAKPNNASDVLRCIEEMSHVGLQDMPLWLMAETPECIANIESILAVSTQIKVLVMGTSDLAKELRLPHDPLRTGLQYALSRCINAARIAGIDVIDGVHGQLDDDEGFANICEQGRLLGFDGKSLIHPKQIDIANQCFSPSQTQLQQSREIVDAWREAEQQGSGIVVVNGKMVEALHVHEAQRLLAIADAIAIKK
jgi:citrate lyase subunit beta/citryl-CoA lyase